MAGESKTKPPKKPAAKKKADKTVTPVQEAAPRGRPSTFDEAIASEICERLSEGEPLRAICRDERMPAWRTVYDWKAGNPDFSARIAHAREAGHDAIAQECLEIADDTANDTVYGEQGERPNTEWINRSKLRIDTRLKLLAKWDPKRYGEKIDLNHGGQENNPVEVKTKVVLVPLKQKAETIVRPLEHDGE